MEDKINNASLSFTCNENWNAMKPDGEARFCGTCQKKVYDLTDKKTAYFIQIMQENNNNACGIFTNDQLSAVPQNDQSHWKRWGVAALLFMGFGTAIQKADAQTTVRGETVQQTNEPVVRSFVLGKIAMPRPPGPELLSLHSYMVNNCKLPDSVNGRLTASFTLKKDGSLTDLKVSSGLPDAVQQEVLRVLKRAHKWEKPQMEYHRPYYLYLVFKNGILEPYQNSESYRY